MFIRKTLVAARNGVVGVLETAHMVGVHIGLTTLENYTTGKLGVLSRTCSRASPKGLSMGRTVGGEEFIGLKVQEERRIDRSRIEGWSSRLSKLQFWMSYC